MKAISVYVSHKTYAEFKRYAQQVGRPVAELIREAMDGYRATKIATRGVLDRMPVSTKPKLRRRWTRKEVQKELLG